MTEIVAIAGTSLIREGKTIVNNTAAAASAAPLADLGDDELVIETRTAWFTGLSSNTFAGIRECQAEALRRGKPHLYDQGYIEFWLGIGATASEAA